MTQRNPDELTDVLCVFNGELITWIVRDSDPLTFDFPQQSEFRGWSLLSPLLVADGVGRTPEVLPLDGVDFIVLPDTINFAPPTTEVADPIATAERLVKWLRLAVGQVELAPPLMGSVHASRVHVGQLPHGKIRGKPLNDFALQGITFDRVIAAATAHPTCLIPVYAEFLHDALDANAVADYRKAILCSAIAVEVMTATRLEESFAAESANRPDRYRLVERTKPGSEVITKDLVLEYLTKSAERDSRLWLDVIPLYVWGRSLSDERPQLYAELLKLRNARNSLAHKSSGAPEKRLPLDQEGANRAVGAAIEAFSWFGGAGRYLNTRPALDRTRRLAERRLRLSR